MTSHEFTPAGIYQSDGELGLSRQQLYFMYNVRKAQRKVLSRKFVLVFSVILILL